MNVPVVLASAVSLILTVSTPLVATPVPVARVTGEVDSPVQVTILIDYWHCE